MTSRPGPRAQNPPPPQAIPEVPSFLQPNSSLSTLFIPSPAFAYVVYSIAKPIPPANTPSYSNTAITLPFYVTEVFITQPVLSTSLPPDVIRNHLRQDWKPTPPPPSKFSIPPGKVSGKPYRGTAAEVGWFQRVMMPNHTAF